MSTKDKIMWIIAAPFIALLALALLIPAAFYTGRIYVHYFGTPSWSLPSLSAGPTTIPATVANTRYPLEFIPDEKSREGMLKAQPSTPTPGAKIVPWVSIYGSNGPMMCLKKDGSFESPHLMVGTQIYHDESNGFSWTIDNKYPVMRGGVNPPNK